jgi:phenylacetate-CoA ligase
MLGSMDAERGSGYPAMNDDLDPNPPQHKEGEIRPEGRMSFFHLRPVPGTSWPPLPVREACQVWAAYQHLDRTQWLPPRELAELQLEQLRTLLRHSFHQSPYYRRVLGDAGFGSKAVESLADLRKIPLLTRHLYQTNFESIRAKTLPAGMAATGTRGTSGTSGVRIQVLQTNWVDLWWLAFYLRDLEWCGFDPRHRLAAIRFLRDMPGAMEGLSVQSWHQSLDQLLEMGRAYALDIRQDHRKQLAWLRRVDPDYLLCMPSTLEFLASLVAESGQRLASLQKIQAIGETVSDATRERIETGFGVPLANTYSCTEAGYVASPCPEGHGLHVHAENVIAEVLDEHDQPCQPGQTGRLVFTTLHNYLAPFIRYDIQDDVTLASGPCPCARGLPLFTHVSGRRHPLLYLPDGSRKIVTGVYLEVKKVGGYHQCQLIQRAVDHVILRLVPDQSWTDEHAVRMREAVQREFRAPIRVDVEPKERLEVPASGKLKRTIIELDEGTTSP